MVTIKHIVIALHFPKSGILPSVDVYFIKMYSRVPFQKNVSMLLILSLTNIISFLFEGIRKIISQFILCN